MPTAKARPADYTGAQKAKLAKEHAEELKLRENEIALAAQAEAEERNQLVDLTDAKEVEVVSAKPVVKTPHVTMRVNDKIEQMTYGAGTSYDFEPGIHYKVDRDLYEHLDRLGYVWH